MWFDHTYFLDSQAVGKSFNLHFWQELFLNCYNILFILELFAVSILQEAFKSSFHCWIVANNPSKSWKYFRVGQEIIEKNIFKISEKIKYLRLFLTNLHGVCDVGFNNFRETFLLHQKKGFEKDIFTYF